MWHRLKNLWSSVGTYQVLSPAVSVRRQVNHRLRDRPPLDLAVWFETCWQSQNVSYDVVAFAYTHLQNYSGLNSGKLRPSDRLDEDLCWIEVCWFDWELTLCHDFQQQFDIDISDRLDDFNPVTLEDLILFLDRQCCARN